MSASVSARARRVPVYDSQARRIPLIYPLQELLRYRYLVSNLVVKDLKVRYKRSSIGFIWVMLNPLLTMAVLTIVFSQVFPNKQPHYAVYVLAGTLLWGLYSQASTASMSSLQAGGPIIRKLYVPPSVFVASAVGSGLVNFVFALVPFFGLCLIDGLRPSVLWLFLVVPAVQTTIFTAGIGLIVAALVVFFQDIFEIYQVLLQLFYFLTPVFYPDSVIKQVPVLAAIERFNPMYLYLVAARDATIYNRLPSLSSMGLATAIALALFLIGWVVFTRVEDKLVYHF